jgi:hypothetical protein
MKAPWETSSSSNSAVLNDIITKSLQENIMKCSAQIKQDQTLNLDIGGDFIGNEIDMELSATLDMNCASKAVQSDKFFNDVSNDVMLKAKARGIALIGSSSAETNTLIKNNIMTDATVSNIFETLSAVDQNQQFNLRTRENSNVYGSDFKMRSTSDVLLGSISKSIQERDLGSRLASDSSGDSEAISENPLKAVFDGMVGLLDSITGPIRYLFIVIGLIIASVIVKGLYNSTRVQPQSYQPQIYQPQPQMYQPQPQQPYQPQQQPFQQQLQQQNQSQQF